MFDAVNKVRVPAFMEGVDVERKVVSATFLGEHRRAFAVAAANDAEMAMPVPALTVQEPADVEVGELMPPPAPPAPEPPPLPPPPAPVIDMSRMDAAIDRLRLLADRLAAEVRSDALELGLLIARKVVEGELAVNADRLINVIKSAVGRVGESRKIVVRLCPEDAELLSASKDTAGGGGGGPLDRLGKGAAKVDVVVDDSLGRGDCVVEGEHLSVDARLDAKFGEIRRALLEAAWDEAGLPPAEEPK